MPDQEPTLNVADEVPRSDPMTEYDDGLAANDWLRLGESVTSHGPAAATRHNELAELFDGATPGLVYITPIPRRAVTTKYLGDISCETEVWCADAPAHLIHSNGDQFLRP